MIFVKDRVKQGTSTAGLGTITFSSSVGGYQDFSVLGNNSQTFYAIEESTNWEVGIGTYSANTLTRDTILASASGDGLPIYLSGDATVFVTYPASGSVFTSGNIASLTGISLGVSGVAFNDGTTQGTAFSYASGVSIDLNSSRISTIETSGLATIDTNLKAVMNTGVALSGSAISLASSGLGYSNRISTIEGSGLTTYVAGTGLTLIGTEFNTTGTGHFDRITFTDNNIQIGDAGSSNTGNSKVIEIGHHAGSSNDNNTDTIFLGRNSAAGGGSGNDNAIFIGTNAGYVGLDADYSVFVGYDAGNSTSGTAYSNLIGYQAGKQVAISYKQGPEYSNVIGYQAGYDATGSYNNYIGYGAGKGTSGNYNIEIQTYRNPSTSVIGDNDNKLHIGNIIIGDTDSKKLAIGNVGAGNLDPDATLELILNNQNDVGFIVQAAAGQNSNLTEWQNSSEDNVAKVDRTGAFSGQHFQFGDGTIQISAATPFSSVSGARVDLNDSRISTIESTGVALSGSAIALAESGTALFTGLYNVSGKIGAGTTYTAGTGLTLVGNEFNTTGTGHFDQITFSTGSIIKVGDESADGLLLSTGTIAIGHQAGRNARAQAQSIAIGIGAGSESSGERYDGGEPISTNRGAKNTYIGYYAGHQNVGINYPLGIANIANNVIGNTAGSGMGNTWYSNIIGSEAGKGSVHNESNNVVGYQAAFEMSGVDKSDIVGWQAAVGLKESAKSLFMGHQAGRLSSGMTTCVVIGDRAGQSVTSWHWVEDSAVDSVMIGSEAGNSSKNSDATIMIGYRAGKYSSGAIDSTYIGFEAGFGASGRDNLYLGTRAGYSLNNPITGNNNIEIKTTTTNSLFANTESSNKLNIGSTIVGDLDLKKLAIGDVGASNLTSDATLEILPSGANNVGLIVQGASAHAVNLTEWQNSSEDNIAKVDHTGAFSGQHFQFGDGTVQTTASAGGMSDATGAKVDLNTTRVMAIMTTGVALSGSVINLASSGLGYSNRISTIETSGVALSGSAISLASSGLGYSNRISTIETSGVALSGSVIALAASGTANFTGLYATSGNVASTGATNAANLVSTGNYLETTLGGGSVPAATGAKIDLNTSRVTAIMTTGVALSGSVINLASSGLGHSNRISTIETSGVALSGSAIALAASGAGYSSRISTIESTGVATAANLIATGVRSQVGHYDIDVKTTKTSGVLTPIISGAGGAKKTFDLSLGNTFTHTLGANTTFYLANVTQGQKFVIRTQQDGTASRTVTWGFDTAGNGVVRWAEGGTAPTGTAKPAGVADVYGFIAIGTGTYDGFVIGNNLLL